MLAEPEGNAHGKNEQNCGSSIEEGRRSETLQARFTGSDNVNEETPVSGVQFSVSGRLRISRRVVRTMTDAGAVDGQSTAGNNEVIQFVLSARYGVERLIAHE